MSIATLTPGIFWYWNSDPSPAGIRKQLAHMRDVGYRCVYLHPMPDNYHKYFFYKGMKIAYLGKRYFELARVMRDECRKLGLTMMLYDEGGWPSGGVVDTLVVKYPRARVCALRKKQDGSLEEFRLDVPDLTDPAVTDRFIEMTHQRYYEELGESFGKEIRGIFTDEPFWECYLPKAYVAIPAGLEAELVKCYGIRLPDILPLLFDDAADTPETRRARQQYVDCCTALFARNYTGRLAAWCQKHGLEFEGHFLFEDLYFRTGFFYDFPRILDAMDVPGVDAIFRMVYPHGGRGNFARFAQCAAIRNRRPETLAECFNVYGYAMSTPAMAYVANLLLTKGINRILTMPYLYSDRGLCKVSCSTDYSPRTPIWRHLAALNRYLEFAGQYHAGMLDPAIRVLGVTNCFGGSDYQKPTPEAEAFAEKVEQMQENLDDALVFWRICSVDELKSDENRPEVLIVPGELEIPEIKAAVEHWRQAGTQVIDGFLQRDFHSLSYLATDTAYRDVRILPCLREEGMSLLVFNAGDKDITFSFAAAGKHYRELPPPDGTLAAFAPLRFENGRYHLPLPAWNMRILTVADTAPAAQPAPREFRKIRLDWKLKKVERLRYSKDGITKYEKITEKRPLPSSGMYTELEPEFSGSIELAASFESPLAFSGFLKFDDICSGGELFFNGVSAGMRAQPPWLWRVEVRRGTNRIVLNINSTAGNEWKRCFREELEPAGYYNDYIKEIRTYENDFAECGAAPRLTLYC